MQRFALQFCCKEPNVSARYACQSTYLCTVSDPIKHECGLAALRLRKPLNHYQKKYGTALWGLNKMFLLMEKQHNRGQERGDHFGAGEQGKEIEGEIFKALQIGRELP